MSKKNSKGFDDLLKAKKIEYSGDNPFLPVIKLVFGEWKTNKKNEQYWDFSSSAAPYAIVLRFLNWKDVSAPDVASYIKEKGGITKLLAAEQKFRNTLSLPNKAKESRDKKIKDARTKIGKRQALKTLTKPATITEVGGFVLLIGKTETDGTVSIRSFADAPEATIDAMLLKTSAGPKKTKDATISHASKIIDMYDHQRQLAIKAA